FDIMYDEGISKEGDVLDLGVELDLIEKRGSFYSYNEERLAQGRENAKQALRENPVQCFEIENAIRRETGLPELVMGPAFDFGDTLEQAEMEALESEEPVQAQDPEKQETEVTAN
ncbi:MAG: DNA recombination/repair protein RecA, partial [Anaerolineae bacterium]